MPKILVIGSNMIAENITLYFNDYSEFTIYNEHATNTVDDYEYIINTNETIDHSLLQQIKKNNVNLIQLHTTIIQNDMANTKRTNLDIYNEEQLKNLLVIETSVLGLDQYKTNHLLSWMIQKQKGYSYQNQMFDGVTSIELAKFIKKCIEENVHGTFHLRSSKAISIFDWLQIYSKYLHVDFTLSDQPIDNNSTSETSTKDLFILTSHERMILELRQFIGRNYEQYKDYTTLGKRIVVIWSSFFLDKFNGDLNKAYEWLEYRMDIFMKYTCNSFLRQTSQDYLYMISIDHDVAKFLPELLKKYPTLPNNILFSNQYNHDIQQVVKNYIEAYYVRIDSDDLYAPHFIALLNEYKHQQGTEALICQNGYIYDTNNNHLAHWFYQSPPFFVLIYDGYEFSKGFRYPTIAHAMIINYKHELIQGNHFVVIVHGKNTVTRFRSNFTKEMIEQEEKEELIQYFDLKVYEANI